MNRQEHWDNIYATKQLSEVSWYQPKPERSLNFIQETGFPLDAAIIDIGGGDSFLVDNLIDLGYSNITVVDISEKAIERAKNRLGEKSEAINWVVSDITNFEPDQQYHLWHDRAVFHFLRAEDEIAYYQKLIKNGVNQGGKALIGTFSDDGPLKCSGLEVSRYSPDQLALLFDSHFDMVAGEKLIHPTPFDTTQEFSFVELIKR